MSQHITDTIRHLEALNEIVEENEQLKAELEIDWDWENSTAPKCECGKSRERSMFKNRMGGERQYRYACRECLDIEYAMWDDKATNAPEVNINLVNHNTAGWRLSYSGQGIQRESYAPKNKEDAERYLNGRGIVDIKWESCWATHCSEAYTATGARK